jgi:uncharacterized protein
MSAQDNFKRAWSRRRRDGGGHVQKDGSGGQMANHSAKAEIVDTGSLIRRWIVYILGIYVLTLGISLAIRAGIGVSPQSSLTRTMTLIYTPLSQGAYSFIFDLIMLFLAYLVLPRKFKMISFLGLVPAAVLGIFLDLNLFLTEFVKPDEYYARVALLVFADAALAFGLFLMIRANLILMPTDLFVNTVFERTGWKWGNVKTGFDCALLITSVLVGLSFLGDVHFIREGTIINAILVGQYIKLYFFLFKKLDGRKRAAAPAA